MFLFYLLKIPIQIYLVGYPNGSFYPGNCGWDISRRHTKELVLNTVLDAIKNQDFKLPKVIHSDQGSEYNCKGCINFLNYLGIQISMSKKQSPWENSHQESFYNNFKTDMSPAKFKQAYEQRCVEPMSTKRDN
jgi:transposase InsO family protein